MSVSIPCASDIAHLAQLPIASLAANQPTTALPDATIDLAVMHVACITQSLLPGAAPAVAVFCQLRVICKQTQCSEQSLPMSALDLSLVASTLLYFIVSEFFLDTQSGCWSQPYQDTRAHIHC